MDLLLSFLIAAAKLVPLFVQEFIVTGEITLAIMLPLSLLMGVQHRMHPDNGAYFMKLASYGSTFLLVIFFLVHFYGDFDKIFKLLIAGSKVGLRAIAVIVAGTIGEAIEAHIITTADRKTEERILIHFVRLLTLEIMKRVTLVTVIGN